MQIEVAYRFSDVGASPEDDRGRDVAQLQIAPLLGACIVRLR